MDREIRNLDQKKANKPILGNGVPARSEGSDGDTQIRLGSDGVRLYIKYNSKWYYTLLYVQTAISNPEAESDLDNLGRGGASVTTVTSEYVTLRDDNIIECDGTFNVRLYAAVKSDGLTIVNIGTGEITITTETINGLSDVILDANSAIQLYGSDAPEWRIA